ncbi:MAG: serine hydrolase [Phycisphaerae bacterium]
MTIRTLVASIAIAVAAVAARAADDLKPTIQPIAAKYNAPAALAAVVKDGKVVGVGVCGVRAIDGVPAAIDDLSMIGSCGKAITRLLIARLVDQGKLTFDARLSALLPDVQMLDAYKSVTIGDVIGHRGGLQPYTEIGPRMTPHLFKPHSDATAARAAFIDHVLKEEPAAKPGERFVYSNAGYSLLGHIAERIAKLPFEQLAAREVFTPLGMRDARVALPHSEPARAHLRGHGREPGGYAVAPQRGGVPAFAPAGMMSCTIGDFAKLAATLVEIESDEPGKFLRADTARRIRELRPGGGKLANEGEPFFGGDGFYTATFALWPSRKMGIVVATNAGDNDAVCAAIAEALRAKYDPAASAVPVEDEPGVAPPRVPLGFSLDAQDADNCFVQDVTAQSLAEKAGLKAGDRIVAINGTPLSELPAAKLRGSLAQKKVTLRIERAGKTLEIVMERPD